MSMRYNKWASDWIENNIRAGANPDVETYADKTKRLMRQMKVEALEAKFKEFEIKEELTRITPLVLAVVSDRTEFDIATHELKGLLAEELEDGD